MTFVDPLGLKETIFRFLTILHTYTLTHLISQTIFLALNPLLKYVLTFHQSAQLDVTPRYEPSLVFL